MAEIDDLLADIARHQDDDAPRWRVADWYDGHDDPERAAFIQAQLRLAQLPGGIDHPDWLPLVEESGRLLALGHARWNAPYENLGIESPRYDRGFIEAVAIPADRLLDADWRHELFRQLPIRHLDVTWLEPRGVERILHLPEVAGLASIGFDRLGISDDDVPGFSRRTLPWLRWLSLTRNNLTLRGVRELALVSLSSMPALTVVDLAGNPYDPRQEIEYDQHVALAWRTAFEADDSALQARWLVPDIRDGRVAPLDRLAFGRPTSSTEPQPGLAEG